MKAPFKILLIGALVTFARLAMAETPVIDWDHLPEGNFQDLLIKKEGLDADDATEMSQGLASVSGQTKVPAFIIYAAVKQESDFQPYGILYDYGNYSCSISQFNISSWCQTFTKTASARKKIGWPEGISCDQVAVLNDNIMYPIYMAANAIKTVYSTGTTDEALLAIDQKMVIPKMPGATPALRKKLFKAGLSFASQCNHTTPALHVMAASLKQIYTTMVPKALKDAHPNMAWYMSDAIYNMGGAAVSLMKRYGGSDVWQKLTPQLYVDILGKVLTAKPAKAKTLAYTNEDGAASSIGYFQICVSQRHVTSITNAGLPVGSPDLVKAFADDCEKLYPAAN